MVLIGQDSSWEGQDWLGLVKTILDGSELIIILVRIGLDWLLDWFWLIWISQNWSGLARIDLYWPELLWIGQDWSGLIRIDLDWSTFIKYWLELVKIGQGSSGLARIGQDWSGLVRIGQDWSGFVKIDRIGRDCLEVVKIG